MGDTDSSTISRRQALKTTAKVAGAAAFAAPVIAGVFRATGAQAFYNCDPSLNSYAVPATNITGSFWNSNASSGYPLGRYNGQNQTFNLQGLTGTISIGETGVDNFDVRTSYYRITLVGYDCTAIFSLKNCGPNNDQGGLFCTSKPPISGAGVGSLPYCINEMPSPMTCLAAEALSGTVSYKDANVFLQLEKIVCCKI